MTDQPQPDQPDSEPPTSDEQWSRRRTSFGDGADNYAVGRPGYPRAALEWALPAGARVALDVGAGTGLLTRGLLALGLTVTAIEPSDGMRAHIPSAATVVAAGAESLPIDDASVDAMFVGQAWHWFDIPKALAEAARVIRPGGALTLMWNLLDTDDPLTLTVAEIIGAEERTDKMPAELAAPFEPNTDFPDPEVAIFPHTERYNPDRIIAYAFSRSQAILLSDVECARLADRLRDAMPRADFDLHLRTECWRTYRA